MIKDKNGVELEEGDTVLCHKLEFKIEEFKNMPSGWMACGDYGCMSVDLLEKVPNTFNSPFTDEQVEKLNTFQNNSQGCHPFTCCSPDSISGCLRRSVKEEEGILIASNDGWVCPCGEYKQDWAWKFMIE